MFGAIIFAIVFLSIFIGGIFIFLLFIKGQFSKKAYTGNIGPENMQKLRREQKILSKDPRNIPALVAIGDIYFEENMFDKAYQNYSIVMADSNLENKHSELYYKVCLNMGISSLNLKNYDDSKFLLERAITKYNDFECNYSLGYINFIKKNYESALKYLMNAKVYSHESELTNVLKYIGICLYELKKFSNSADYLRKVYNPLIITDNEVSYYLGMCCFEMKQNKMALEIFSSLENNEVYGGNIALLKGAIFYDQKKNKNAIEYFEKCLTFSNIDTATRLQACYKLANTYMREHDNKHANIYLKEVYKIDPDYKDVYTLLQKTGEMVENKGLSEFLNGSSEKFTIICKKLSIEYFKKYEGTVNIVNVKVTHSEGIVVAEVDTPKWESVVYIKYLRTITNVGELSLREISIEAKDVKADKIICMTAGHFTEESKKFVETRSIELIEKSKLAGFLKKISK